MKITVKFEGKRHALHTDFEGQDHAIAKDLACPHCGNKPLGVVGSGRHIADDDRAYVAEGYCYKCKGYIGQIRAEVDTIFGLHEDEAVLFGRCRVY